MTIDKKECVGSDEFKDNASELPFAQQSYLSSCQALLDMQILPEPPANPSPIFLASPFTALRVSTKVHTEKRVQHTPSSIFFLPPPPPKPKLNAWQKRTKRPAAMKPRLPSIAEENEACTSADDGGKALDTGSASCDI